MTYILSNLLNDQVNLGKYPNAEYNSSTYLTTLMLSYNYTFFIHLISSIKIKLV